MAATPTFRRDAKLRTMAARRAKREASAGDTGGFYRMLKAEG
jgi:hypothetical protein